MWNNNKRRRKNIYERKIEILKALLSREKTQIELRRELKLSKSYLSEILSEMENDGLIKRKNVKYAGKITKLVSITKKGKEYVTSRI